MNSQFLKKGTLKQSHASSNSCVSSPCELPHDSAQNQARSKLKGPCAVTDKARRQLVRAFGNTTNDMTKNLCIAKQLGLHNWQSSLGGDKPDSR